MHRMSWIVALSMAASSASAADATVEPGLYEIVTKTSLGPPQTERKCLTASDLAKSMQPSDLGRDCKVTRSVLTGGKIDYAVNCPDMAMASTGSYTATSYALDGKMTIKGDEPMNVETHIAGKKVGACKAG